MAVEVRCVWLVGCLACKNEWRGGMVICLQRWLMICICSNWCHWLPIISFFIKAPKGAPLRCWLTQAVLKRHNIQMHCLITKSS